MDEIAERYERDGYCFPIRALTPERAADYRAQLQNAEAQLRDPSARKILIGNASFVLSFVDEIMRLPSVLQPVRSILGPDLLVLGAAFFIKEPQSPDFVSWHQDLTYWGLDDVAEVTAWVALSPSTAESGCMRFVPGTHRHDIAEHRDTFGPANMLSRGQELAMEISEDEAVDVVLEPGEMSLHHGHMFHSSLPNRSAHRRIGLAIRYISPTMRLTSGLKAYAHCVLGQDRWGHFHHAQPARGMMEEADVTTAMESIAIQEQIRYRGADQSGRRVT